MAALGKARVPTDAELKRLLNVTRADRHSIRNVALLAVSYRLGLRAKEIASLRVRHVLGENGHVNDDCMLSEAMTKGGKPRVVYLSNPALRQALREYLDERQQKDVLFSFDAPLFMSQQGGAFSPNSLQQLLRRLHYRAGIVGGRSHSGRRWFATQLISKGIDLKAVATLMGHRSISMTAQYAEDNPQRLRRIAAELA